MADNDTTTVGNLIFEKNLVEEGSEDGIKRYVENFGVKIFVRSQIDDSMVHAYQFEIIQDEGLVIIQIDGQKDNPNNHSIDTWFDCDIYLKKSLISMMRRI